LIHSFGVFYSSPESKVDFIEERLNEIKSNRPVPKQISDMYGLIFQKISSPVSLSKAFAVTDEASAGKVSKIMLSCLEIVEKASSNYIRTGEGEQPQLIKFLGNAQKIMLSHAARAGFKGEW
jgi:hypothetical protein